MADIDDITGWEREYDKILNETGELNAWMKSEGKKYASLRFAPKMPLSVAIDYVHLLLSDAELRAALLNIYDKQKKYSDYIDQLTWDGLSISDDEHTPSDWPSPREFNIGSKFFEWYRYKKSIFFDFSCKWFLEIVADAYHRGEITSLTSREALLLLNPPVMTIPRFDVDMELDP